VTVVLPLSLCVFDPKNLLEVSDRRPRSTLCFFPQPIGGMGGQESGDVGKLD
jgi:hypothetical protein